MCALFQLPSLLDSSLPQLATTSSRRLNSTNNQVINGRSCVTEQQGKETPRTMEVRKSHETHLGYLYDYRIELREY